MKKIVLITSGVVLVMLFLSALMFPKILPYMGLHPEWKGQSFNLQGCSALIMTTSHFVSGNTGKKS